MIIYTVKQTQPSENYFEKVIAIFSTKKQALKQAKELNREYRNSEHFYEVEAFTLDNFIS